MGRDDGVSVLDSSGHQTEVVVARGVAIGGFGQQVHESVLEMNSHDYCGAADGQPP